MSADDAFQPYQDPELDENGLPIQPPVRGRRYWVIVGLCACALIELMTVIVYFTVSRPNEVVPAWLRMQVLGAELLGLAAVVLGGREKVEPHLQSRILQISVAVTFLAMLFLFPAALQARGYRLSSGY